VTKQGFLGRVKCVCVLHLSKKPPMHHIHDLATYSGDTTSFNTGRTRIMTLSFNETSHLSQQHYAGLITFIMKLRACNYVKYSLFIQKSDIHKYHFSIKDHRLKAVHHCKRV